MFKPYLSDLQYIIQTTAYLSSISFFQVKKKVQTTPYFHIFKILLIFIRVFSSVWLLRYILKYNSNMTQLKTNSVWPYFKVTLVNNVSYAQQSSHCDALICYKIYNININEPTAVVFYIISKIFFKTWGKNLPITILKNYDTKTDSMNLYTTFELFLIAFIGLIVLFHFFNDTPNPKRFFIAGLFIRRITLLQW